MFFFVVQQINLYELTEDWDIGDWDMVDWDWDWDSGDWDTSRCRPPDESVKVAIISSLLLAG